MIFVGLGKFRGKQTKETTAKISQIMETDIEVWRQDLGFLLDIG